MALLIIDAGVTLCIVAIKGGGGVAQRTTRGLLICDSCYVCYSCAVCLVCVCISRDSGICVPRSGTICRGRDAINRSGYGRSKYLLT